MEKAGKKARGWMRGYRFARLLLPLTFLLCGVRFALPWLIFKPSAWFAGAPTPAALGLPFEDVTLSASDGVSLRGWFVPAPNARAVLLFFHGNAGNISHRLSSIEIFHGLGLSVFIFDYRGYGQSGGKASIEGTALDALAAWRWLTEEKKILPREIVVFGRSLGGAVAAELSRSVTPGALILESTFSSLAEMVRIPFLEPLAKLVVGFGVWNSAKAVSASTVPTLCVHSPDDRLVPYRLGKRLYNAVAGEKKFFEIHGGHNEGFLESIDIYRPVLDAFLTRHFRQKRTLSLRERRFCRRKG
jgi:fermentation-respiration switch protein FrsA (DUF1100 family)